MAKEVTPEQIEMLDGMVAKARAAAEIIATYDQERVDRLCQAVAASVIDMKVWANLADEAVDETGLGDKVTKRNKRNKLKLILRDCLRQKSVGVIEEIPEKGIVKYAKPVGVIASLVPTTNPCLTPAGQVIYAIKARDVIICSPHPRAKKTTNKCINIIRETLVREGAPADIIQGIEEPSITLTQELMALAAPGAMVQHCLPPHRGEEISPRGLRGPRRGDLRGGGKPAPRPEGGPVPADGGPGPKSNKRRLSEKTAVFSDKGGAHDEQGSIACAKVAPSVMRWVIFEAHVPENDVI